MLDKCNTMVDPEARNGCVAEAQRLILENATMVPIFTNFNVIAAQPDVQDYTLDFFSGLIPGDVRAPK